MVMTETTFTSPLGPILLRVRDGGLTELAEWLSGQVAEDTVERATAELERRGLVA